MNRPAPSTLDRFLVLSVAMAALGLQAAHGQVLYDGPPWTLRLDMGGTVPQDATLTRFDGLVSGERMKFSPGLQMDLALDCKLTPWLAVGPELGMIYNPVESFGSFSYHDTYLFQMPLMANVRLECPTRGPFVPYIGTGIGGVASVLTFGESAYWEPDGTGSDFSLAFQGFAGLDYRFNDNWRLGVIYRFLYTDSPDWDIEWWNDYHFHVAANSVQTHSLCLVFSGTF